MKVEGLIWLEEIEEKLWRKHRVETDEVWEIFEDKPRYWFVEKGNLQARMSTWGWGVPKRAGTCPCSSSTRKIGKP